MDMHDCFVYDTNQPSNCKALSVCKCQGEKCAFYKSKQKYEAELIKLYNRSGKVK